MITSPKFGEGKSMVTANLAISIARQGEKVLVIDADLRKPTLHFMFKVENKIGLTDVLDGKILMKEAVNKTAIKRLDLLTSGDIPINSTELLSSELMKQLMEEAAIDYDIVLFDTPPVLKVADTSILANQCDSVILVVKYGKTESEKALEAKTLLERARAKVLGIILNGKS
jgi:protein-tyrosine kinase